MQDSRRASRRLRARESGNGEWAHPTPSTMDPLAMYSPTRSSRRAGGEIAALPPAHTHAFSEAVCFGTLARPRPPAMQSGESTVPTAAASHYSAIRVPLGALGESSRRAFFGPQCSFGAPEQN